MLSVLLLGFDAAGRRPAEPGEAVRTLASFVPAAVDGIVRDLCLAGPEGAGFADIADHAGCAFATAPEVKSALAAGSRRLRAPQVLVVQAGTVVDKALIDELASLLPIMGRPDRSTWAFKAARQGFFTRLVPSLAPTAGLICSRVWLEAGTADSFVGLARQARRVRLMKSTAVSSPA